MKNRYFQKQRPGMLLLLALATATGIARAPEQAWTADRVYVYEDPSGGLHFSDRRRTDAYSLFLRSLGDPKSHIFKQIERLARKHNVSPYLVRAMVRTESSFNPQAISRAGAMGLMQLMPGTAMEMQVGNPLDVEENITGGIRYLKRMLKRFGSVPLALAAYNAGPTNVQRHGGIPPYPETQNYVKKVLDWEARYRDQKVD